MTRFWVERYSTSAESTLGLLWMVSDDSRKFLCYTLEDTYHPKKIVKETRIPEGEYKLEFRNVGGFNKSYKERFSDINHRGMIQVKDVPGFEYILIHCGNNSADTAGCLLVGDSVHQNISEDGFLGHSRKAYRRVYEIIAQTMEDQETTIIKYINSQL